MAAPGSVIALTADELRHGPRPEAVRKFPSDNDRNGCVVARFVQGAAEGDLLMRWAGSFCALGEKAADELRYWEGHGARGGEAFGAQLRRQVREDFGHMRDALVSEDGVDAAEAAGLTGHAQQERLVLLVESMMQLYDSACAIEPSRRDECPTWLSSECLFWSIKLEVNAPSACIKFHDDLVNLRLVTTVVGDGTVLASNHAVNWDSYEQGSPGEMSAEGGDASTERSKAWNHRVVAEDIPTRAGDAVLMKGGASSAARPCLHRAPYSADLGSAASRRFLITVERVSAEEKAEFAEMFGEPMAVEPGG